MNLMPLVDLLATNQVGIKGENLFINMLPPDSLNAILVRNTLAGTKIDYELPKYFRTEFQLIVRGTDYTATSNLIAQAVTALTLVETQVENQYFKYCRPSTEPTSYPISKGDLIEFNVVFDVCMVES